MNQLLQFISLALGLMPFHRMQDGCHSMVIDYLLMLLYPTFYMICYILVTFSEYGLNNLPACNSICRLGSMLFVQLGCFTYLMVQIWSLLRRKTFFMQFDRKMQEIDEILEQCRILTTKSTPRKRTILQSSLATWTLVVLTFIFAIQYDVRSAIEFSPKHFFFVNMLSTFPFVASSVVQAQFIAHMSMICKRFGKVNELLQLISNECSPQRASVTIYDIDNEIKTESKLIDLQHKGQPDDSLADIHGTEFGETVLPHAKARQTSENNLPLLFKVHSKILSLCVLTNREFGPKCVPYMAMCFVSSIFGVFLSTKVIFVVGGKSPILDYIGLLYVIWMCTSMMVAYFVLRLCCNASGHSKQSAMIVHEIMQKKPAFMLANDKFYNKMKSFTLQFLHWESYFYFNAIGLFPLDYTFIFSAMSAATSYLIVLLQFDMTAILKSEGLID